VPGFSQRAGGLMSGTRVSAHLRNVMRNFRGDSRQFLGRLVTRLIGQRLYSAHLPVESISSILICRINGRLETQFC